MLSRFVCRRLSPSNAWRLAFIRESLRIAAFSAPPIRTCNVCGYSGCFHPFGFPIRPEARCPECSSLERHRAFKLWFDQNSESFLSAHVLHFASEECVTRFVKPVVTSYVTADLEGGRDLSLNVEKIDLPDEQFDLVICSHVLEHVDDRAALGELHRIIKKGGLLIVMVPVIEGWDVTYEDAAITTYRDRELAFGQRDHLRVYGSDFRKRIEEAMFIVSEYAPVEPFVTKYGLVRGEKVFVGRKPGVSTD